MTTFKYTFKKGEPPRLIVSFRKEYDDVTISIDGGIIASKLSRVDLISGKTILLPDGTNLKVQLVTKYGYPELNIYLNDNPLPGSPSDPDQIRGVAQVTVLCIGILYIILGIMAGVWEFELLISNGLGFPSIMLGSIFLILSCFAKKQPVIPLVLAITLIIVDVVYFRHLVQEAGYAPSMIGIYTRIVVIIVLLRVLHKIYDLKKETIVSTIDD